MEQERLSEVEKTLAVHLAECAGKHRVIGDKLESLETKIDGHIQTTTIYREKTLHEQIRTRNYLLYGFAVTAVAMFFGPEHAVKLLSIFLKGG